VRGKGESLPLERESEGGSLQGVQQPVFGAFRHNLQAFVNRHEEVVLRHPPVPERQEGRVVPVAERIGHDLQNGMAHADED
jgi:hypothetical protein